MPTSLKKSSLWLAILIVAMFVLFVVIREVWQKGGYPLRNLPGRDYIAIALLVVVLIIIWWINKKAKTKGF